MGWLFTKPGRAAGWLDLGQGGTSGIQSWLQDLAGVEVSLRQLDVWNEVQINSWISYKFVKNEVKTA